MQAIQEYLTSNLAVFLTVTLLLALAALLVSLVVLMRIKSVLQPFKRVSGSTEDPGVLLPAVLKTVEDTDRRLEDITGTLEALLRESRSSFRHVGLVRYDAFEDVGGQQSYSLCMLDSDKNGFLVTNLTRRNSTRSYAVIVDSGEVSRRLSDEETRAMSEALDRRQTVPAP
jgi:hypothetical protein